MIHYYLNFYTRYSTHLHNHFQKSSRSSAFSKHSAIVYPLFIDQKKLFNRSIRWNKISLIISWYGNHRLPLPSTFQRSLDMMVNLIRVWPRGEFFAFHFITVTWFVYNLLSITRVTWRLSKRYASASY